MSTHCDHHNDAERQARVDRMLKEFLDARSRRFGKPNGNVVNATFDPNLKAPRLGTTISPFRLLKTDRG